MPKQRYYPQCKQCSGRQSGAVRAGRRTLVLHFGGPKAPYYAGLPPIPLSVCLCGPASFKHIPDRLHAKIRMPRDCVAAFRPSGVQASWLDCGTSQQGLLHQTDMTAVGLGVRQTATGLTLLGCGCSIFSLPRSATQLVSHTLPLVEMLLAEHRKVGLLMLSGLCMQATSLSTQAADCKQKQKTGTP